MTVVDLGDVYTRKKMKGKGRGLFSLIRLSFVPVMERAQHDKTIQALHISHGDDNSLPLELLIEGGEEKEEDGLNRA